MERDKDTLATRPNGRPTSLLVVREQGRKPLFTRPASRAEETSNARLKDKENDRSQLHMSRHRMSDFGHGIPRRMSSEPLAPLAQTLGRRSSSSSLASPGGTRIPKPSGVTFSSRKQLSLSDAFNRAAMEYEEESDQSQVMDASPSPAPRVARAKREEEDKRMRKILGQDHLDTKAPNRPFSRASLATSTLGEGRVSPEKYDSPRRRSLYGKSRIGLGSREPAQDPISPKVNVTKPNDQAEDPPRDPISRLRPEPRLLKHLPSKDDLTNQGRIPALVPGIEDLPWPSIENRQHQQDPAPPTPLNTENASPEKSFAWEVDQDFTAGDLQISDSPRIKMGTRPFADRIKFDEGSEIDINSRTRVANPGSRNTKLDEIRSREVKVGSNIPLESPQKRQPNTKIEEIRQREAQAEHQIPIPDRSLPRPSNTKLNDIRQREINGIPNRALAKARLDEIREQNSNSRSLSPEEYRPLSARTARETTSAADRETKVPIRPMSAFEIGGQRIPDTPVTIFKARETKYQAPVEERGESSKANDAADVARPELSNLHKRGDSRDLLRRLARAASSSPAPETEARRPASPLPSEKPVTQDSDFTSGLPRRTSENAPRHIQHQRKDNETSKPTVGFTGIPRTRSTDSVKSKRSSMQSELDPTDRIEGEMKLFALGDNQSEKGSIRAPSPLPDSEDEKEDAEATPRAPKPDPLTMPTPKIMGAYVETPATVKVEKIEVKDEKPREETRASRPKSSSWARDKKTDHAWESRDQDTTSDPGTDEKSAPTAMSSGVRRRRTRSLPRRRGPLRNSAKPPTVKDDLMQLQRSHQIEDSTLDDLEEILLGRKAPTPKMEALLNDLSDQPSLDDDFDFNLELDTKLNTNSNKINPQDPDHSDGDLATFTRMSKSLQTGLMGIRTAKKGIERLEGQVLHETKSAEKLDTHTHDHERGTGCTTHVAPTTVSYVPLALPLPNLYRRKPSFRLTFVGIIALLFSLWYAAESAMCAAYCRPTSCGNAPCVWSFDDPTFGNALPVKLDQWATGGHGRVLMGALKEEVADWSADLVDMYYGREMTEIDVDLLSFEQKRQHRRRLLKKGLLKPRSEQPEQQAKWDAWRQTRMAKERVRDAREMGYYHLADDGDEAVGGDQRVW
ncbi:hypothetical protein BGZ61DRAFT_427153 [Ilyonectria robusta]|uniref:uncharacterized protein n=1 Tax=Ilyonectria robusta TaxID=1079257 RepID=UPI001E8E397E|nr:uncharacterized protein BGZ61DRAFT_427153 [Ilyonectria robusta]KAH8675023.1 hypothetical protein BGZ61DRAFT_427153 [Ilyonectria robusta]